MDLPVGGSQTSLSSLPAPATTLVIGIVSFAVAVAFLFRRRDHECKDDNGAIPNAAGGTFLLGHALAYTRDPAGFLQRQSELVGSMFRINLAGRRMVVMCGGSNNEDMDVIKMAANKPERVLSAREAVADVGFEFTLGKANVYEGTELHKRLIKDHLREEAVPLLALALKEAYTVEIDSKSDEGDGILVNDFLGFVRRTTIRAVVDVFLGRAFLREGGGEGSFLTDFMALQDAIEDATAAAAVLPHWLSLPFVLRPVARKRETLQKAIAKRILNAWKSGEQSLIGPWLIVFRDKGIHLERASEYVVGLLFAAHKNPAIGSAQAYLYLRLDGSRKERNEINIESKILLENPTTKTLEDSCLRLRTCCLETLRLTSHSVGAIRKVKEDVNLGKCPLVKDDIVAISHIVPSCSRALWGDDADTYRPSRVEWTDKQSYPDEFKFSAFSQGLHRCPGQKVALYIMQLNLAILCSLYDVKFTSEVPNISFERATLAQRDGTVSASVVRLAAKS